MRIAAVATHDLVMAAASFEIAVWLRYWTLGAVQPIGLVWEGTLVFTLVSAVIFWWTGLYRGIWHYASLNDFIGIARAVTLAVLIFLPMLFALTRLADYPRTSVFINWPLLILMLGLPRLVWRLLKDRSLTHIFARASSERVPVLLVGAVDAAETFIREMARARGAPYAVVGIVADQPGRVGRNIRGVRVFGTIAEAPTIIERLSARGRRPQRLILASDTIDGAQVRWLFDLADRTGMTLARLPRLTDFRGQGEGVEARTPADGSEVRPVGVEDLLGRPQRVLDRSAMRSLIAGRRVMVTGAGGTIGGELSRQVSALGPARIALLDNGEHNLYRIDQELSERFPELSRGTFLGDVRDPVRISDLLAREQPELVFHAAAFKHVPLSEGNPNETVLTNVLGTRLVAEACRDAGVDTFVLISTDKAVNPSSVMGASKRVAEMLCQALGATEARRGAPTRFVTVRFGNVLGSTGSVVPLFRRQLAAGGPLTVTHPDVSRYFMTTREAVELVLQASALPQDDVTLRGKLLVLDMGEPVRIQDLARQMIRLAGRRPDKDIAIVFTGLRPGEKLQEELLHEAERLVPTSCDGIMLAAPRLIDYGRLAPQLDRLTTAATSRATEKTLALLGALVPEYSGPESVATHGAASDERAAASAE